MELVESEGICATRLDLGGRNFVASCHEIPSAGAGGAIRIYPRISWSPLVLTPGPLFTHYFAEAGAREELNDDRRV